MVMTVILLLDMFLGEKTPVTLSLIGREPKLSFHHFWKLGVDDGRMPKCHIDDGSVVHLYSPFP